MAFQIRLTTKDDDYPIIYYGFQHHPRWCKISAINSSSWKRKPSFNSKFQWQICQCGTKTFPSPETMGRQISATLRCEELTAAAPLFRTPTLARVGWKNPNKQKTHPETWLVTSSGLQHYSSTLIENRDINLFHHQLMSHHRPIGSNQRLLFYCPYIHGRR